MHIPRSLRPLFRASSARFHTSTTAWAVRKLLKEFKLADIGEGITECEVIKWSVKPASSVQVFDPLCEVQSDKASVEITSPFDGIVTDILVKEGDVAKVGSGLCTIEVEEDDSLGTFTDPPNAIPASATAQAQQSEHQSGIAHDYDASNIAVRPKTQAKLHPLDPRVAAQSPSAQDRQINEVLATPSVRHFARQKGVDLALLVPGSGKAGRMERQDVEAFLTMSASRQDASSGKTPSVADVVVELGRTRFNMWKAMTKSLEIPQFGFSTTFDLTALHEILPLLNSHVPARYLSSSSPSHLSEPVVSPEAFYAPTEAPSVPESARYSRLTYLPFLMKTLSKAMQEWPLFRSSITPPSQTDSAPSTDNRTLTIRPHADISIALSTPTGLYTPTIQRVDTRSVYALASQLKHMSFLGRQTPCALTPADMPKRGGTITISNVGGVGHVDYASPVLVPGGGVTIVAIGRAKWIWDVNQGDGQGKRRLTVGVSWSADHRVVEGAELIAFAEAWKSWVEAPQRLIADCV